PALRGEGAVRRVGQGDAQGTGAEVHARDEAEVACEGDLLRAAARARRRRGLQDAARDELLDDVRHGRRGQAGDAGQLDLRERATLLDGVDDPGAIGFTQ